MSRSIDDLHPWEESRLREAFAKRLPRESDGTKRQSREDFTAGWIACLEMHHVSGAFKPLLSTAQALKDD